MKRAIAYLAAALLLAGCASLPEPQGKQSSLVVGSFKVAFPDGFFGRPPRTIESLIRVRFTDLATGNTRTVFTGKGGYFYFTAVPGHSYRFDSWDASQNQGNEQFSLGPNRVNLDFDVTPGKIVSLGETVFTFASPQKVMSQSGQGSTWNFHITSKTTLNNQGVYKFISQEQKDSSWLKYDIIPVRYRKDKGKQG